MTRVTSQAPQKVGKGTTEKISLQMTAEILQRRCRRDSSSFQTRAAATEKGRLPAVNNRVQCLK